MRLLLLCVAALALAACATAQDSIDSPMHDFNGRQVGWEVHKADDGDPQFVIRSAGSANYTAMLRVAEQHAKQRCAYGYRVISIGGADQPQIDILNPRLIIGGELRLEVHCFERDNL